MRAKGDSSSKKPPPPAKLAAASAPTTAVPPCGACKFLRRKCTTGCVFSPYFGMEQGAARFAAVHKVFGASNVSKLIAHVPAARRHDAMATVCFEAQARLADPVYGCVFTILALQQQVASLQAELSIVQSQLIDCRLAAAGVLQCYQPHYIAAMQPAYSNNSSTSTNMENISSFQPSGHSNGVTVSCRGFQQLQPSQPSKNDDDEEESQNCVVFSN